MIYLVGVNNHNIQHDGIGCADLFLRNKFSAFLKNEIVEHDIVLLAEEFNEEALYKISKGNIATVQNVVKDLRAENFKIEHRFCEPSIDERELRGILSPAEILSKKLNIKIERKLNENEQKIFDEEKMKSFFARESIWFEKISNYLDRNVIFVCGVDHIRSFEILLTDKRYKPIILIENWSE